MNVDEILAKSTERPWEWSYFSKPDGSPISSNTDVAETTSHSAMQSERAELWGICHPEKDEQGRNIVVCYTGNGPTSEINSALIALAVNSFEKQREVIRELTTFLDQGLNAKGEPYCGWTANAEAALARAKQLLEVA